MILPALFLAAAGDVDFCVVGHLRGDGNGQELYYLDTLVEEIRRLEPDFVVLTGDLVWGDVNAETTDLAAVEADWDRLDAALARIGAPIHYVPGNHDINDLGTRDLFLRRYGPIPAAARYGDVLCLFVSSAWIPSDGDTRKHPQQYIRGVDLDQDQIGFLRDQLEAGGYQHAFVFMHHLLWWPENGPWWDQVHPLLASHDVRAVFSGDYGPLKFSHTERDGVRYVQSSVENHVSIEMQRALESARVLSAQLDNFLLVQVRGPEVRIEVRTVAPFSDKFTPQRYREVYGYDRWSFGRRVQRKLATPDRLLRGLFLVGAAGAAGGAILTAGILLLLRRRAR